MKLNKGLLKLMVLFTLCICLNGVSAYAVPDEVPVKTVNVALKNSEKRTLKFMKGQKLQMLRFGMKMKRTTFTSSKLTVISPSIAQTAEEAHINIKLRATRTIISTKARIIESPLECLDKDLIATYLY